MKYQIDINCDLGEGLEANSVSNDAAIMPYISSCNIACGFHAGNLELMHESVDLAIQNTVSIGAHPGYNDPQNFGRKYLDIPKTQLQDELCFQISLLQDLVTEAGAVICHVKPHGALYNAAAVDIEIANCIAASIALVNQDLIFYGLANSKMAQAASLHNLAFAHEAFIDRAYQANGKLLPRSEPNAVISDPAVLLPRALQMITRASVVSIDGTEISLGCDTLCLHGDSPDAPKVAKMLAGFLNANAVEIEALAY